ncbi:hypothetical protein L207DRAFT_562137 [Hyaloscypha variabilis F]|uniref:Zn(2)-C6 fungal-type domain-containing protein n=1 Tax=Hyaloscypha variabilis (strain UAMH 11265 / GT02V1 / F) TaxID=1149755 RepID=A0A2J6S851_HYAVF|nr:hypothetical protein L207DRAFT_562137 [Hyaloscypha variabilis F]
METSIDSRGSKEARSRRHLPKTRTGCGTCKIRRVKCGEEKPHCRRCITFGSICDGYEHVNRKYQTGRPKCKTIRALQPKSSQVIKNPFATQFQNEKESWYFDKFCSKTSYEILPDFKSQALRQMLLQASQEDLSIRHIVAALGALDETNEHMPPFPKSNRTQPRHQLDALEQYSIALKHMKKASLSGKQEFRLVMLGCLAIICFEAWNGNHTLAVQQITVGLKIIHAHLREILADRARILGQPSLGTDKIIEADLLRAFAGLDVYAPCDPLKPVTGPFIFDEDSNQYLPEPTNVFELEGKDILARMPEYFECIEDAQFYGQALKVQTIRFLATHRAHACRPSNEFHINEWWGPWDKVSQFTIAMHSNICDAIFQWNLAFQPLWKKLKSGSCSTRLPAIKVNLQTRCLSIALLVSGIEDEEGFDIYTKDFQDITNFAEYVLDNTKSTGHNFILESNIVHPLLLVAHKCRDMTIRRRAIALMFKYPLREVVWDGMFCGKLGQWIMDLEEQYLNEAHVPGWARIRGITVFRDARADRVTLRCTQKTSSESEEVTRCCVMYECGSLSFQRMSTSMNDVGSQKLPP